MVIRNVRSIMYGKSRPRRYKAKDAAFATGGNGGFVLAFRPGPYPITNQQRKVRDTAEKCGIKLGISKAELQKKMVDCVGPAMRK